MQLSNLTKTILFLAFSSLVLAGCNQTKTDVAAIAPPADALRAEPPFANEEPENYQAEIKVTAGAVVERFFAVRKGANWRIDAGYGDPGQVTTMKTDKDYVLSMATKTYSDYDSGHGFDERSRMIGEISRGMINNRAQAVFEKIGTEGTITKYRKRGEATKDLTSIISFDEKLGLPVRMEIFKNTNGTGPADVTVELVGFKAEPDEALLAIPKDFKLVPLPEMKKVLIAKP